MLAEATLLFLETACAMIPTPYHRNQHQHIPRDTLLHGEFFVHNDHRANIYIQLKLYYPPIGAL